MMVFDTFITATREGGPLTLAILGLGLLCLFLAPLLPLITGFTRSKKVPASLSWLLPTGVLLLGVIAGIVGVMGVSDALTDASAEFRMMAIAQSIAQMLFGGWLALTLASATFLMIALAGALPAPIRPGPEGTLDLAAVGGALLGGFVGWLFAGAGIGLTLGLEGLRDTGVSLPVCLGLTVLGGLAVLVSAIRIDKEDKPHRGRMAALRVFVGTSGFLAVSLAGGGWQYLGTIEAFQAVASAPPDMRTELMSMGIQVASYAAIVGSGLGLVPLLAGLGASIPGLRNLQPVNAIGLALAVVVLLVVLAAQVAFGVLAPMPFSMMTAF